MAMQQWLAKQAELDAMPTNRAAAAEQAEEMASVAPSAEAAESWRQQAAEIRAGSGELADHESNPLKWMSQEGAAYYRIAKSGKKPIEQSDKTLSAQLKLFTDFKKSQALGGERSMNRADAIRLHLDHFAKYFGEQRSISEIDENIVEGYYSHLLKGKGAQITKRDRFATFKQFINNRFQAGVINLPRNLNSREYAFRVEIQNPEPMPLEDFKALLHKASDRSALYLCLMLNCGMYGRDITALRIDEIDFENRTITRRRTKTKHQMNSPTVTYPLWERTFNLLKQEANKEGDLALTNAKGEALIREEFRKKDGKLKRTDNIRSALGRLYKWMGDDAPNVPPKHIRKLGATMLAAEYGEALAYRYLADVPSGVAARHYIANNDERFAAAIAWLEQQVKAA